MVNDSTQSRHLNDLLVQQKSCQIEVMHAHIHKNAPTLFEIGGRRTPRVSRDRLEVEWGPYHPLANLLPSCTITRIKTAHKTHLTVGVGGRNQARDHDCFV